MEAVVDKNTLEKYYSGKKVFLTGHTGFKGSWLAEWLILLGAQVRGYSLSPEYQNAIYENSILRGNDTIADIRDKEKLQKAISEFRPDYIFHLAAQPLVRRSYDNPVETFDINVLGTAKLLEAIQALTNKCTVIVVTTDKVYENTEEDVYYKESDKLGGYDPYSASKACAEIVSHSFARSFFHSKDYEKHQKRIVTARAGNVIGGGDYSEDRIIPDIIRSLEKGEKIPVRNPASVRPWQHVLEPLGGYLVLAGVLHTGENELMESYNFGPAADGHLTVQDLVAKAIEIYGGGEWDDLSQNAAVHEARMLQLDISAAAQDLGWKPKLSTLQSIEWTIGWYKEAKENKMKETKQQIIKYMEL